jgi:hypothetical protein
VVVRTGALDGPLGEVVADRLAHVVSDTDTRWDAWRREDGRWTVSLTFRDDVQERVARWSFDPTTNSVTVDDETSRWLTEGTSPQAPEVAAAPARPARGRRLLSVPDLQPKPSTAADDHLTEVIDLGARGAHDVPDDDDQNTVAHDEYDEFDDADSDETSIADELAALGLAVSAPSDDEITALSPVAALNDTQTELDLGTTEPVEDEVADEVPAPQEAPAAAKKPRKSAKRASVPSWDDIVFGARKND